MDEYAELKGKLKELFIQYGVVPQGYDIELWTKEENDLYNARWKDKAEPFEKVVSRTVEGMFE